MTVTREDGNGGEAWLRVLVGIGLLLPAVGLWLVVQFLPTLQTFLTSLQQRHLLGPAQARFVGLLNYEHLLGDPTFPRALGFTLSLLAVRLLVVAVVPLLLAFAVNEFGRWVRVPVRLLFTVPLALLAPVATAVGWLAVLNPHFGLVGAIVGGAGRASGLLSSPEAAPAAVRVIEALNTFGLACGLGLIFYLAALRGSGRDAPGGKVWRPLLASWLVGLLATAALSLQSFALIYVLTRGGPAGATMTLGLLGQDRGLVRGDLGYASAVAVLLLLVVMVLGPLAGLVIVLGRLRLEMVPVDKHSGLLTAPGRPGWLKVVAVVLLVCVLLPCLAIGALAMVPALWDVVVSLRSTAQISMPGAPLWPAEARRYLYEGQEYDVYRVPTAEGTREWALVQPQRDESYFIDPADPGAGLIQWKGNWRTLERAWTFGPRWENYREALLLLPPLGQLGLNTCLPPLLAILLFQVPIAYLGALGIGAVRPLRKWSEVLLLPFSPWLFVTALPLSMAFWERRLSAGLGDRWIGLVPPILLSVPMLFVLTLFFKGQEPRWRAARAGGQSQVGAFFGSLVLPSLPLVALLACGSLLLSVWDVVWPLMVGGPENLTANEALLHLVQLYGTQPQIITAAMTLLGVLPFAFFFLAFGLLQALYLDRLALTADGAGR